MQIMPVKAKKSSKASTAKKAVKPAKKPVVNKAAAKATPKTTAKVAVKAKSAEKSGKQKNAFKDNIVAKQYAAWVYPAPPEDLAQLKASGDYDLCDPNFFGSVIWPKNTDVQKLNILVAGCGTRQAAELAYNNPQCTVLGIDISEPSLQHEQYLKEKHNLDNLDLKLMSLLDIKSLGQKFDYVVSVGVLHHLPDPDAGLRALKSVLKPQGVMQIMVYGQYRRLGVYMMQQAFRTMNVKQTPDDVEFVKQTLSALPAWHHVRSYMNGAPDLGYDSGVVDTFLHPQDRAYTVPQILEFAEKNGLQFRGWLDNLDYAPTAAIPAGHPLLERIQKLPREQQWAMMELIAQSIGCHRFMLCHKAVESADFTPVFKGSSFLDYKPKQRFPTHLLADGPEGAKLKRGWHEFSVSAAEAQLYNMADGKNSIRDILKTNNWWQDKNKNQIDLARTFYARMHEWGHLMFEI